MKSIYRIFRALLLALRGHRGQKDKAGKPYWHHLLTVAWIAYGLTHDPEAVVVGLLHDYKEDLGTEAAWKIREVFGSGTWREINGLSRGTGMTYKKYIDWIVIEGRGGTLIGRAVKLADLLHNTMPGRLPKPRDAGEETAVINRLYDYQQAIDRLTAQRTWNDAPSWKSRT